MLGLFCGTDANTNGAYKQHLKKRIVLLAGLFLIGIVTLCISWLADLFGNVKISQEMLSMYSGFGVGMVIISILLMIKNIRIIRNEHLLKKARVSSSDERNMQISRMAMKAALAVLIIAMYLVMLIGGLWYPVLVTALSPLICLFLIVYYVAYRVISRKI